MIKAKVEIRGRTLQTDLAAPIDISIPLGMGKEVVSAWYVDPISIEPVVTDQFIGDVNQGGAVNFRNITFNPHGNGTHTECVGHISSAFHSIHNTFDRYFFLAELITVQPVDIDGDKVITKSIIEAAIKHNNIDAIVIRTLPNSNDKVNVQYSNSNPPYLEESATKFIVDRGIDHLLIDLPSVDKEVDNGALRSHKTFWDYPENPKIHRTITELIYVKEGIADGLYLLNIQTASFVNDASPSKPVLYSISEI